jgi:S1-C subfamily serine protease
MESPARGGRLRAVLATLVALAAAVAVLQWTGVIQLRAQPEARPRAIDARGDLEPDEKATIQVFRDVSPSVAFITTVQRRAIGFREVVEVPAGNGSGFVWDADGHVVTNFHVIQGGGGARVTLHDTTEWPAELVGISPDHDLAVLKIGAPAEKLVPIKVGRSADLVVGQKALAIGNPFGLDFTLTTGIVSALGRSFPALSGRVIEDVIQTDAAINPGNSGGPLLDSAGRLIGVNTLIASPSGASAGVGFAVPVDTVNRVVPQLIAHGKVVRPQLGIQVAPQTLLRRAGVKGVLVVEVQPGSPAERAGLRGTYRDEAGELVLGDVIQGLGGREVASLNDLHAALERHEPGETVTLRVLRDGATREVPLTLAAPR